jgi:hypothetical protein
MSKSVIKKNQFSSANSPQTPHDDQHIRLDAKVGSFSATMKTTTPQSAPVVDSHPAFSLWWERWRARSADSGFPAASRGKHSGAATGE